MDRASSITKRYYCDYNGYCYGTRWQPWWVGVAIGGFVLVLLSLCLCVTLRRRRNARLIAPSSGVYQTSQYNNGPYGYGGGVDRPPESYDPYGAGQHPYGAGQQPYGQAGQYGQQNYAPPNYAPPKNTV